MTFISITNHKCLTRHYQTFVAFLWNFKLCCSNRCLWCAERDPTLRIKYSKKHPMFSDDGHHHQHKKHKISADAYTARSNELYQHNLLADVGRHSESSHHHSSGSKHSSSSKHGHHSSQHDRHHSSSHEKHEQKKQHKVCLH